MVVVLNEKKIMNKKVKINLVYDGKFPNQLFLTISYVVVVVVVIDLRETVLRNNYIIWDCVHLHWWISLANVSQFCVTQIALQRRTIQSHTIGSKVWSVN